MNSKALATIVVVIVIGAAAAGAYYFLTKDKDKDSNDYSLLDSNDNIKAGMTIEQTLENDGVNTFSKLTVDSVEDGKVKYTRISDVTYHKFDEMVPFSSLKPTSFLFDYTGEAPEGFEIKHSGYVYTINGSGSVSKGLYTYDLTCTDLKITYNGTDVTEVFGKMHTYSTPSADETSEFTYEYKTDDGKLLTKLAMAGKSKSSIAVESLYEEEVGRFKESRYEGATVTHESGKYRGFDMDIYTVNGTSTATESTFENVKLSVYNGYLVGGEGNVDGKYADFKISIYMA